MLSIIVPMHNSEQTIKKCLESILNQTYRDIEIIVIDDGSEDRSFDIVKEIAENHKEIMIFSYENQGVSSARNHGIKKSKGEFILFVDSDDYIEVDMINSLITNANKADMIICGINAINNKDQASKLFCFAEEGVHTTQQYIELLQNNTLNPFFGGVYAKLFKSRIIKENKIYFNNHMSFAEDFCFNMTYLSFLKSIYVIRKGLYNYIYGREKSLTMYNYTKLAISEYANSGIQAFDAYVKIIYHFQSLYSKKLSFRLWEMIISKISRTNESIKEKVAKAVYINKKYHFSSLYKDNHLDNRKEEYCYSVFYKTAVLYLIFLCLKIRFYLHKFFKAN